MSTYIVKQDKNGRAYAHKDGKPYSVAKAQANIRRSEAVKKNLQENPRFRDETGRYSTEEFSGVSGVRRQEDDFWKAHAAFKFRLGYAPKDQKHLERILNERNPGYVVWNPRLNPTESYGPQHFKREYHG